MTARAPLWLDTEPRKREGPGRVFLTTDRFPVFYFQITKCGCTFIRNLLYYLDHDTQHEGGDRIHADSDALVKGGYVPPWMIRKSPFHFTVIRDPVDRFLSLYFDKIADLDSEHDQKMRRKIFKNAALDIVLDNDLPGHQENCLRTLNWLRRNLAGKTIMPINPHWGRQSNRLKQAAKFDLIYLTLDGLSWQLPVLLAPLVPDIEAKMATVRSRNKSRKLFSRAEIVTPEIEQAVAQIYKKDAQRYHQVAAKWADHPDRPN